MRHCRVCLQPEDECWCGDEGEAQDGSDEDAGES
jgi:hypothetical protein